MPAFVMGPDSRFPAGTTLRAWRCVGLIPVGSPVVTVTVGSDGTATFSGLAYGTKYLVGKTTAGPFTQVPATPEPEIVQGNTRTLVWDDDSGNYLPGAWRADTATPRIFCGPEDPAGIDDIVFTAYDTWNPSREPVTE